MSTYIIVNKSTKVIQSMLTIDGIYMIDNANVKSYEVPSDSQFNFKDYSYVFDENTGKINAILIGQGDFK